jgi:uncharacterized membrane protein YeiB
MTEPAHNPEPARTSNPVRTPEPVPSRDRLVVPDVLRGVALLAMLIAHADPLLSNTPPGWRPIVFGNANDVASPLFALVMGLSAQIVLQRTPAGSRGRMLLQQLVRGAVLIALGVWMANWGSWVAVVLGYLGLLLIVGAPILILSTRWVAAIALGVALMSDPVNAWARSVLAPLVGTNPLANEISALFVLGYSYRLTNLLPFFLLGALLMRHGFRRDRALWAMAVIAPVAYAVRPVWNALSGGPEAVSGSYPDTLHDLGLVLGAYVVVVLLATVRRPGPARVIAVVFEPLRAIGAVALSLYLLHVAILALWSRTGYTLVDSELLSWLIIVPGMVVAGWLWWRFIGVGPVEYLLGWVTGRPKKLRAARAGGVERG